MIINDQSHDRHALLHRNTITTDSNRQCSIKVDYYRQ